jgi:hypothetical protein
MPVARLSSESPSKAKLTVRLRIDPTPCVDGSKGHRAPSNNICDCRAYTRGPNTKDCTSPTRKHGNDFHRMSVTGSLSNQLRPKTAWLWNKRVTPRVRLKLPTVRPEIASLKDLPSCASAQCAVLRLLQYLRFLTAGSCEHLANCHGCDNRMSLHPRR